ncbi:MAG: hypothetical protein Q7J04_02585, partial [Microcella sp.]|nr:hypothetical protein [Microcella sp.]
MPSSLIVAAPPVATPASAASITLPGTPVDMVFSPSGHRLYTANIDDDSVSVVNPATGAVLSRIPVQYRPNSIALSPDGTTLVTGHNDVRGLTVITLATGVTRELYTSNRTNDLLFSSDGTKLFVTSASHWINVRPVPSFAEGTYIDMPYPTAGLHRQPGTDFIWTGQADPSPFYLHRFNERTRATQLMSGAGYTGGSLAFPAGDERVFGPPGYGAAFVLDLSYVGNVKWRRTLGIANDAATNLVTTLDRSVVLGSTSRTTMLVIDPLAERVIDEIDIGQSQASIAVRPVVGDVWLGVENGLVNV